jgi:hypothetical protein
MVTGMTHPKSRLMGTPNREFRYALTNLKRNAMLDADVAYKNHYI